MAGVILVVAFLVDAHPNVTCERAAALTEGVVEHDVDVPRGGDSVDRDGEGGGRQCGGRPQDPVHGLEVEIGVQAGGDEQAHGPQGVVTRGRAVASVHRLHESDVQPCRAGHPDAAMGGLEVRDPGLHPGVVATGDDVSIGRENPGPARRVDDRAVDDDVGAAAHRGSVALDLLDVDDRAGRGEVAPDVELQAGDTLRDRGGEQVATNELHQRGVGAAIDHVDAHDVHLLVGVVEDDHALEVVAEGEDRRGTAGVDVAVGDESDVAVAVVGHRHVVVAVRDDRPNAERSRPEVVAHGDVAEHCDRSGGVDDELGGTRAATEDGDVGAPADHSVAGAGQAREGLVVGVHIEREGRRVRRSRGHQTLAGSVDQSGVRGPRVVTNPGGDEGGRIGGDVCIEVGRALLDLVLGRDEGDGERVCVADGGDPGVDCTEVDAPGAGDPGGGAVDVDSHLRADVHLGVGEGGGHSEEDGAVGGRGGLGLPMEPLDDRVQGDRGAGDDRTVVDGDLGGADHDRAVAIAVVAVVGVVGVGPGADTHTVGLGAGLHVAARQGLDDERVTGGQTGRGADGDLGGEGEASCRLGDLGADGAAADGPSRRRDHVVGVGGHPQVVTGSDAGARAHGHGGRDRIARPETGEGVRVRLTDAECSTTRRVGVGGLGGRGAGRDGDVTTGGDGGGVHGGGDGARRRQPGGGEGEVTEAAAATLGDRGGLSVADDLEHLGERHAPAAGKAVGEAGRETGERESKGSVLARPCGEVDAECSEIVRAELDRLCVRVPATAERVGLRATDGYGRAAPGEGNSHGVGGGRVCVDDVVGATVLQPGQHLGQGLDGTLVATAGETERCDGDGRDVIRGGRGPVVGSRVADRLVVARSELDAVRVEPDDVVGGTVSESQARPVIDDGVPADEGVPRREDLVVVRVGHGDGLGLGVGRAGGLRHEFRVVEQAAVGVLTDGDVDGLGEELEGGAGPIGHDLTRREEPAAEGDVVRRPVHRREPLEQARLGRDRCGVGGDEPQAQRVDL